MSAAAETPRHKKGGILPTAREATAAFISGALFAFAFPPFNFVLPALVCLVPLAVTVAWYADRNGYVWNAARTGFWFGAVGYGANLYWIAVALLLYTKLALLGYLGTLVWLSPVVALTAAALFVARRQTGWPFAILLPIVWVASELSLNYLSDLSFPWLPLGLSVAHVPVLAQFADVSGVRGVSFWIAAVNGLLADAWLWRPNRGAVIKRVSAAVAIVLLMAGYGVWRMHSIALTPLASVGIIQPNIPEEAKLTIQDPTVHVGKLTAMTRDELSHSSPQLVLWPEAALDQFLWRYPNWRDSLQAAVRGHPTPILTGVLDSDNPMIQPLRYYNAAIMTTPDGYVVRQDVYRKQFLVPIVERVPFLNPEWFRGMNYFGGFSRGQNVAPFATAFGSVGVMICYESIYPQLARSYARQGATALVNITNDAWFQHSLAPYQHFAHLSLRAIENRLPVVRAANTGISGYIDPLGRVRAATPIFVQRAEVYAIESAHVTTLYTHFGDWIGVLCAIVTVGMLLVAWMLRTK